jgi:16S rRNA (cytosine1402-N4)-methyltransferase
MSTYHTPVLFDESLTGLITNTSGIYADATFGGGGHTAGILSRLQEDGRVIAFDRDGDALENRIDDPRLTLVRGDFRFIRNYALEIAHSGSLKAAEATGKKEGTTGATGKKEGTAAATKGKGEATETMTTAWDGQFDGILADLGVSSHQFDTAERGFSFRYDAPLDMRMNRKGGKTAAEVVNEYSQEALEKALSAYGELANARKLAQMIVAARNRERIETTGQLNQALRSALPKYAEHKFLAKVYQALRIEVNHEMRSLEKFLEGATESLKEGGRLVVITYHSLEDRMVKNFIKTGRADGREEKDLYGNTYAPLRPVNRKPILPAEEEIAANTRARSAKLRIAEKIGKD